jgi:hypothetical protein
MALTPEQEIRARAIDIKFRHIGMLAAAALTTGRLFNATGMWTDEDLEDIVAYITDGTKPKTERT